MFFIYYTQPGGCYEGKAFIGLNLALCVSVSIVAVLPKVQVSLSEGGTSCREPDPGPSLGFHTCMLGVFG